MCKCSRRSVAHRPSRPLGRKYSETVCLADTKAAGAEPVTDPGGATSLDEAHAVGPGDGLTHLGGGSRREVRDGLCLRERSRRQHVSQLAGGRLPGSIHRISTIQPPAAAARPAIRDPAWTRTMTSAAPAPTAGSRPQRPRRPLRRPRPRLTFTPGITNGNDTQGNDRPCLYSCVRLISSPRSAHPVTRPYLLDALRQRLRRSRHHLGHRPPPARAASHRLAYSDMTHAQPAQLGSCRVRREVSHTEHRALPPPHPSAIIHLKQRRVAERGQPPPCAASPPAPHDHPQRPGTPAARRGSAGATPACSRTSPCSPHGRAGPAGRRPATRTQRSSHTVDRTRSRGTQLARPHTSGSWNAPTRPRRPTAPPAEASTATATPR